MLLIERGQYRLRGDAGEYVITTATKAPEFDRCGNPHKHAGEVIERDPRYYSNIRQAVRRLATLVSDDEAADLEKWLQRYDDAVAAAVTKLEALQ